MTNLTVNQLIEALEASVLNDDLIEFGIVIKRLHSYSLEQERSKIIQKIDELVDKYPNFDWTGAIAETEDEPAWIFNGIPTKHPIKLERGLYLKLKNSLGNQYYLSQSSRNKLKNKWMNCSTNLLKISFLSRLKHSNKYQNQ